MQIMKWLILGVFLFAVISAVGGSSSKNKNESSYTVGYLIKGALWQDSSGEVYRNLKDVQIEIWSREIVASDGSKLTQIFFLEGANQGLWGYTDKRFTSPYTVKKAK